MAAKRKYYNLIKVIHEEWCVANGYPIGRKPFFSSGKLRKAQKIPVSGTPNRETGSAECLNSENSERFVSQAHKLSSTEAQASKPQAKGSSFKPKSTSSKIR